MVTVIGHLGYKCNMPSAFLGPLTITIRVDVRVQGLVMEGQPTGWIRIPRDYIWV